MYPFIELNLSINLIMLRTFKLILPLLFSLLFNNERGWIHPQTGWEIITNETMCFYIVHSSYLDNAELEDEQNDVIGVFFNDQNIYKFLWV